MGGSHERVGMGCVLCWTGRGFLLGHPRYEDPFPLQLPRNFQRLYLGQSLAQGFRSHPWSLLGYWGVLPALEPRSIDEETAHGFFDRSTEARSCPPAFKSRGTAHSFFDDWEDDETAHMIDGSWGARPAREPRSIDEETAHGLFGWSTEARSCAPNVESRETSRPGQKGCGPA